MNSTASSRSAAAAVDVGIDELIDLLADDALDAPRRAALLHWCDAAPEQGGWRQIHGRSKEKSVSVIGFSYVLSGRYFAIIRLVSPAAEKAAGDAPPRLMA